MYFVSDFHSHLPYLRGRWLGLAVEVFVSRCFRIPRSLRRGAIPNRLTIRWMYLQQLKACGNGNTPDGEAGLSRGSERGRTTDSRASLGSSRGEFGDTTVSRLEHRLGRRKVKSGESYKLPLSDPCPHGSAPTVTILWLYLASWLRIGVFRTTVSYLSYNYIHPSRRNKATFRKRKSTGSGTSGGNSDQSRCERIQHTFRGADSLTAYTLLARKQRAADGVKILLDIAKESSDWFPPLKSALGGVSALVKHYEVSLSGLLSYTLTPTTAGIRRCQGEARGSYAAFEEVQGQRQRNVC